MSKLNKFDFEMVDGEITNKQAITNNKEIKHSIVPCKDCIYSIYQKHDLFTGKPRWFCGNNICVIDEFGDETLMCDFVGGGCEFGKRKVE